MIADHAVPGGAGQPRDAVRGGRGRRRAHRTAGVRSHGAGGATSIAGSCAAASRGFDARAAPRRVWWRSAARAAGSAHRALAGRRARRRRIFSTSDDVLPPEAPLRQWVQTVPFALAQTPRLRRAAAVGADARLRQGSHRTAKVWPCATSFVIRAHYGTLYLTGVARPRKHAGVSKRRSCRWMLAFELAGEGHKHAFYTY